MGNPEGEVLVDLVGDNHSVVPGGELHHFLQRFPAEDDAQGVVRIVEDHHPGALAERVLEGCEVRLPVRSHQRSGGVRGPGQADHGSVGIVERLEGEHFVAGAGEGENRRRDGFGGSGADDDVGLGVGSEAVEPLLVPGDRRPEHGLALAGSVLVLAIADRRPGGVEDLGRAVLVREALPEVDGAVLERQSGDLLENGDAKTASLREQVGAAGGAFPWFRGCGTGGAGAAREKRHDFKYYRNQRFRLWVGPARWVG